MGPTGPQGPAGPVGPAGSDGADGLDGLDGIPQSKADIVSELVYGDVLAGSTLKLVPQCDDGVDVAIGGGCRASPGVYLYENWPGFANAGGSPDRASWTCGFENTTGSTVRVYAYIHCIDL
jgi:hypothetical protein